jgi:tryptophan halogenase
VGNGLVYCSRYLSDDEAAHLLLKNIEGERITEPRLIKYRTGQRKQYWNKNCIALGLASGFIEPLESTSIHFIQNGIMWLLLMFPDGEISPSVVDQYNATLRREAEHIRDFIIMHYHVTERDDTEFWNYCRTMSIPDSLRHRLELFRESGRVFKPQDDVFAENSWVQVMMGQGITPEQYHPIVDTMADGELQSFLQSLEGNAKQLVAQLPAHGEFVKRYCELAGN